MQESTRNIATTWWVVSRSPLAVLVLCAVARVQIVAQPLSYLELHTCGCNAYQWKPWETLQCIGICQQDQQGMRAAVQHCVLLKLWQLLKRRFAFAMFLWCFKFCTTNHWTKLHKTCARNAGENLAMAGKYITPTEWSQCLMHSKQMLTAKFCFVFLQPLGRNRVECTIRHERDVHEQQHPYICGANKQ